MVCCFQAIILSAESGENVTHLATRRFPVNASESLKSDSLLVHCATAHYSTIFPQRRRKDDRRFATQATLNHVMVRWVWLGLLALVELIWLSMRIDFHTLSGKAGWWAEPLSHADMSASIALASLAVGALMGWSPCAHKGERACWLSRDPTQAVGVGSIPVSRIRCLLLAINLCGRE